MTAWWDDVRFATRRLGQQPGFTLVAVLTLSLGLGANTAIFTLIHAVMMRPLPVTRPAELYRLGDSFNCCVNTGLQRDYSLFSYPMFRQFQDELTEFSDLAAFQANPTVTAMRPPSGGPSISAPAVYVSANYFRLFGVSPAAGRLMEPGDDEAGAAAVMVMSHRTWVEQLGADPDVIGRSFLVNGVAVALAGVTERGFFGETIRANPAGIWLPLGQEPVLRGPAATLVGQPDKDWLYAIGRVRSGAPAAAIGQHATRVLQAFLAAQSFVAEHDREQIADQRVTVASAASGVQQLRGTFGDSLTLLFAMSGLVLLIASANLANLLLARADRAQAAVRAALGASAGRLTRQALAEGLLLALAGCAGALIVAMAATRAIVGLAFPPATVLPIDVVPSLPIVAFSVSLALVTGALFGAAPALASARVNPIEALRGLAREGADRSFVPRRSLVIVQVTLSLVLLTGAGLLAGSLSRLEHQPLGFAEEDRLVVRIDVPPTLASVPERLAAIYDEMQARLRQVPGVERATYSLYSPMEGNNWSSNIAISGRPVDPGQPDGASWNRVGPDYFETLGTRVLRGRGITAGDSAGAPRVAVVNDAFVRTFFEDRDPLSARLGIGDASHADDYQIVGVVEDVKYSGPAQPVRPMAFFPVGQRVEYADPDRAQTQARSTLVRTVELQVAPGAASLEPAIRRAVAGAHPDIAVTGLMPMSVQVAGNFRNNRLLATLAGAYGGLALLLAALGLYGVTSYGVARRTHEIGVRMALGADARRIVTGVLWTALVQAAVGLAIGLPLALLAGRALTAQLYGIDARDPLVLAGAAGVLLITAALAAALPARRASSVNPTQALRAQ
jgi:predicted permease